MKELFLFEKISLKKKLFSCSGEFYSNKCEIAGNMHEERGIPK